MSKNLLKFPSAPIVMSDDFNEVGLSLLKYSGTVIGGLALHSLIILPIVFIIGKSVNFTTGTVKIFCLSIELRF